MDNENKNNDELVEYNFDKHESVANVLSTMVPVNLVVPDGASLEESFFIVRETLRRIGIPSYSRDNKNALYQSCHILHKQGKYYICHFKQLLALDGRSVKMSGDDLARLLKVAWFLNQWKLVDYLEGKDGEDDAEMGKTVDVKVKILRHSELSEWKLVPKHNIGLRNKN